MKYIYLFIILSILYISRGAVNGSTCTPPIIVPMNGTMCYSPFVMVIANSADYTGASNTPYNPANAESIPMIGYFQLVFRKAGFYNLTVTSTACEQVIPMMIYLPEITLNQPQCPYMTTDVYISGLGSYYTGPSPIQVSGSGGRKFPFQTMTNGGLCSVYYNIIPINNTFQPMLNIVSSMCNTISGSITVENYKQFSELTLNIDGINSTLYGNTGTWANLTGTPNDGKPFTIYAKSEYCGGYQTMTGLLYADFPAFDIVQSRLDCNSSYVSVSISSSDLSPNTSVTINGNQYVIPNTYDFPVNTPLQVSYGQCSVTQSFTLSPTVAPISYSLDPPDLSFTRNTSILTITYLGDLNEVSVTSNKNGQIPINMTNGQLVVDYLDTYTISIGCYSQNIVLYLERVRPIYRYTESSPFCYGDVEIIVDNYQLFDKLVVTDGLSVHSPLPGTGRFVDLYHSTWTLVSHEIGAPNDINVTIDLPPSIDYDYTKFKYTENITRIPDQCKSTGPAIGYAEVLLSYENIISTQPTIIAGYNPFNGPTLYLYHPKCVTPMRGVSWSTGAQISATTYSIVQPAQCPQSTAIVNFIINGNFKSVSYYPSWTVIPVTLVGNTFNLTLPSGNTSIVVSYNGAFECWDIMNINIPVIDSTKVFGVTVNSLQNPNNCDVSSGKLFLPNYSQFSNLTIQNGTYDGNGIFTSPSTFSNTITYTHSYCGNGKITGIAVKTDSTTLATISVLPYRQPTCDSGYGLGDGAVKVYLSIGGYDQTSLIKSVSVPILGTKASMGNIVTAIGNGNQEITIYAGTSCIWNASFSLSSNIPSLYDAEIVHSDPGRSNGYIKLISSYNASTYLEQIQLNPPNYFPDSKRTSIVGLDSRDLNVTLNVDYAYFCKINKAFNLLNVETPKPQYLIHPDTECGSLNMYVEITQESFERFQTYLVSNDNGMVYSIDQNTRMFFVPPGSYALKYDDRLSLATSSVPITVTLSTSQLPYQYEVVANETCAGKNDGKIKVFGFPNGTFVSLVDSQNRFQTSMIGENGTEFIFSGLSSQKQYQAIVSSTRCSIKTLSMTVSSDSPKLVIENLHSYCVSKNITLGKVAISTYPSGLNATYTVDGVVYNPDATGKVYVDSLSMGDHLVTANIEGAVCASFLSGYATIKNNTFKVMYLNQVCQGIVYAYSNPNFFHTNRDITLFAQVVAFANITEHNFTNTPTLYNQTKSLLPEERVFTLDNIPAGNYSVWAVDSFGGCEYFLPDQLIVGKCYPAPPNTTSPPRTTGEISHTTSMNHLINKQTITLLLFVLSLISFITI